MCKENVDPKDLENQVMPTSETPSDNEDKGEDDKGGLGNTGQNQGSSGDGTPVRPQPNWGVGGLSLDEPEDNENA